MSTSRLDHAHNPGTGQRLLAATLRQTMRLLMKPVFHPRVPVSVLRPGLTALASVSRPAAGVERTAQALGGVSAERHDPSTGPGSRAILYFHGGAYCVGSPRTHRGLASHLAAASDATVWVPDYALAPEAPFPAALDDAVACYRDLVDKGHAPADISIAGDSAGGGLALALAMRLRDDGEPMPSRMMLISPWADLTNAGQHAATQVRGEVMLSWGQLEKSADLYAHERQQEPYVSPLLGDLHGLPPCLIVVGTREILLSDSERLLDAFETAGAEAHLVVYEGLWHVFPAHAGMLDSADDAIARLAAFSRGQHFPPEAAD
ncbi:MAG: alpha/beta hydrolase [Alcanivoracaceae bacterium]|jgi:acetyl esterase/lipase|nr:alpha/beta hydrolase [Alcanivoracaceae bacterium]